MEKANERGNKRRNLIFTAFFSGTFLFLLCFWLFSINCVKIYNYPVANKGIYDVSSYEHKGDVPILLSGEWELYYNQWIVSEPKENNEITDYVTLPHWYANTKINGKALDKHGYASYKLKVIGVHDVKEVFSHTINYLGSYRCYINGELLLEKGIVSKNPYEAASDGADTLVNTLNIENLDSFEIVYEVSASLEGGLHSVPWLEYEGVIMRLFLEVRYISMFVAGLLFCLMLFVIIVSLSNLNNKKNYTFSALLIILFFLYCFSIDFFPYFCSFLGLNIFNIAQDVCYLLELLLLVCFIFHIVKNGIIKLKKYHIIGLLVANLICVIFYYIFKGTPNSIYFSFIQLILASTIFYPLSKSIIDKRDYAIAYSILLLIMLVFCGLLTMDYLDFIIYGADGFFGIIIMFFSIALIVIFFHMFKKTSQQVVRNLELEAEVRKIKTQALKAQIKPHFIFNTLSCIQNLYHEKNDKCEDALIAFSKHLRTNIDAEINELIPLEKELMNIINYTSIENLRKGIDYNVIIDCECLDFKVPVLSLQPYVENSIKYSKIELDPNGYILITSKESDEYYYLEVRDNGVGFDISSIKENSQGLKNATERLKLLMNATVEIKSSIGDGTTIVIKLPKEGVK